MLMFMVTMTMIMMMMTKTTTMMMMMPGVPRAMRIHQDRREPCMQYLKAAMALHKQQNWIQDDDSLAQNLTKKLLSISKTS